ncbi:uncharacterized protein [Argopecten irradians]|uniref:uncharacterized protein n=1 Tax=Argopecten irradians TaxID=31199 RepID=UPI00371F43F4
MTAKWLSTIIICYGDNLALNFRSIIHDFLKRCAVKLILNSSPTDELQCTLDKIMAVINNNAHSLKSWRSSINHGGHQQQYTLDNIMAVINNNTHSIKSWRSSTTIHIQ